jgi:hypothetical protein
MLGLSRWAVLAVLAAASVASGGELERPPEECLARPEQPDVASAFYDGKTYRFRFEGCRQTFLEDPERYSQLYDALSELQAQGAAPAPQREPSLVPS